jgi:error-prone DNA polymerase
MVQGLQADHALQLLEERRRRPFISLEDFKSRVHLNKDELRTLAEIGALNCFARHRREALWRVEKEEHPNDLPIHPTTVPTEQLPITNFQLPVTNSFARFNSSTIQPFNDPSPLPPMDVVERLGADYNGTGVTTGPHPMSLARPTLPDVWRASDLPRARHGSYLRIAGNVICRQRPGTAKGFVFISLEDETGTSNAIITPQLFDQQRLLITQESFLLIEGRVQNIDNVVLIKAERIEPLSRHHLVGTHSHDFH